MTNPHLELYGMAAPPPQPAAPPQYDYVGGNPELDQLLAMEQALYDQQSDVAERLKDTKDRIKVALTGITRTAGDGPNTHVPFERYRIAVPGQIARVLRWKVSRRINSTRLKKEQPALYEAYSSASGAWYLEREK